MKKINYRKLLTVTIWTLSIAGLLSSLAFVSKKERDVAVKGLDISIHQNEENYFLDERDVRMFLESSNKTLISRKFSEISIPELESVLNTHPAIENAEVAADISGELKIKVSQRKPVCRIINMDGESYYIDSKSKLMPLNDNYTARVIIANGYITEPYARRYQYSVDQIRANKVFSEVSVLDDVLDVVRYIQSDSTLNALIQQIYVNEQREMELYPVVGSHTIVLGDAQMLPEKFNKLKLFYTEGLNKTDSWNKYSLINLKYKNQVVCTKK